MKRMIYLVREVAVIVQIEESIKIKEEFIPLELRELPIVAGLGEDLHIAHVVTSVSVNTVTHCSLQSLVSTAVAPASQVSQHSACVDTPLAAWCRNAVTASGDGGSEVTQRDTAFIVHRY